MSPADWPDGSFRGLRARGGLSFDVTWRDGKITAATVQAKQDGRHQIAIADEVRTVELRAGEQVDLVRAA